MLSITRNGSIKDILDLITKIPEFQSIHKPSDFQKRFKGRKFLILLASWQNEPVGFKVGYDRYSDGSFYSWLGAVRPEFRKKHIALKLAEEQEKWARDEGFSSIRIKTRNKFATMLIFLLKYGFKIIDIEKKNDIQNNRIHLQKIL